MQVNNQANIKTVTWTVDKEQACVKYTNFMQNLAKEQKIKSRGSHPFSYMEDQLLWAMHCITISMYHFSAANDLQNESIKVFAGPTVEGWRLSVNTKDPTRCKGTDISLMPSRPQSPQKELITSITQPTCNLPQNLSFWDLQYTCKPFRAHLFLVWLWSLDWKMPCSRRRVLAFCFCFVHLPQMQKKQNNKSK